MKNILTVATFAAGLLLVSSPAFAGNRIPLPEPVSMSLLAGGIAAIAAVKGLRRK